MKFYQYIFSSLVFFILCMPVFSKDFLTQEAVENYKKKCWPSPDYKVDLRFAPIRGLPKDRVIKEQWGFEYTSKGAQYANNKVELPVRGAKKIDSVLTLNKSESTKRESYLWHVVATPTVVGWRYGGHWPLGEEKDITKFSRLKDKKFSLINVTTLSVYNGDPVYTNIDISDVDKSGDLKKAWEKIFSEDIVTLLYDAFKGASNGGKGYSLTFFYVPTPTLNLINKNGYRWPTSKHVDRPGFAYSFVLTPEGSCIASNLIEIIR